jgi:cell division protease FtsH
MLPQCDPVHKVSIISRGMSLGYTISLPDREHVLVARSKFEEDLSAMLAGRVAEQLVFDDVTNSAVNDLDRVTKLARAMVTQYGMSSRMGPMVFGQRHEMIFLGREIGEQRNYSERVAREIDEEVKRIVQQAYDQAREILTRYSDLHHAIAERLMEIETLEAADFEAFFENVPGAPPRDPGTRPQTQSKLGGQSRSAAPAGEERTSGTPAPSPVPA